MASSRRSSWRAVSASFDRRSKEGGCFGAAVCAAPAALSARTSARDATDRRNIIGDRYQPLEQKNNCQLCYFVLEAMQSTLIDVARPPAWHARRNVLDPACYFTRFPGWRGDRTCRAPQRMAPPKKPIVLLVATV